MTKIKISKINNTLVKALTKRQIPLNQAKIIANDYLEGELQGKHSHGLMAFPSLIKVIKKPSKKIKTLKQTQSLLILDAQLNYGAIVGQHAVDWLVSTTKKQGLAGVLIKNMRTWLRPGSIAQKLSQKNLISIVVNNGGRPMTAPPGGYDPVIGTNPIAIGIPTENTPILADMATSVRAWGEVKKANRTGKNLPPNAYYDQQGRLAENPKDAYSALPMGDYKGFSLGLLIEILACSLLGQPMSKNIPSGDYRIAPRGAFILAINPKISTSLKKFKTQNSQLAKYIKQSSRLDKKTPVILPGERSSKIKKTNLKKGYLNLDPKLWQQLQLLAS